MWRGAGIPSARAEICGRHPLKNGRDVTVLGADAEETSPPRRRHAPIEPKTATLTRYRSSSKAVCLAAVSGEGGCISSTRCTALALPRTHRGQTQRNLGSRTLNATVIGTTTRVAAPGSPSQTAGPSITPKVEHSDYHTFEASDLVQRKGTIDREAEQPALVGHAHGDGGPASTSSACDRCRL